MWQVAKWHNRLLKFSPVAGQHGTINWGEDEDAEVSSEQACHGEKAMKATFGNDVLLLVGKRGAYALDFKMFVPNNKRLFQSASQFQRR